MMITYYDFPSGEWLAITSHSGSGSQHLENGLAGLPAHELADNCVQTRHLRFSLSSVLASQGLAQDLLEDVRRVQMPEHLQEIQACMVVIQWSPSDSVS
jgi:energy-coupling factor transporter ATP-binding protein EcfA2